MKPLINIAFPLKRCFLKAKTGRCYTAGLFRQWEMLSGQSSTNTALGSFYSGLTENQAVPLLMTENAIYLKAISTGAVFFGACSYIGNAPNFMVRSIAEESGTPMPSFFGYILKYALVFLVPIFVIVSFIFF